DGGRHGIAGCVVDRIRHTVSTRSIEPVLLGLAQLRIAAGGRAAAVDLVHLRHSAVAAGIQLAHCRTDIAVADLDDRNAGTEAARQARTEGYRQSVDGFVAGGRDCDRAGRIDLAVENFAGDVAFDQYDVSPRADATADQSDAARTGFRRDADFFSGGYRDIAHCGGKSAVGRAIDDGREVAVGVRRRAGAWSDGFGCL